MRICYQINGGILRIIEAFRQAKFRSAGRYSDTQPLKSDCRCNIPFRYIQNNVIYKIYE